MDESLTDCVAICWESRHRPHPYYSSAPVVEALSNDACLTSVCRTHWA